MAVKITRAHNLEPDEVDARFETGLLELANDNGLSVIEKSPRRMKMAGMGVTGEITWDDAEVRVQAHAPFAYSGIDTQVQSLIEAALSKICND